MTCSVNHIFSMSAVSRSAVQRLNQSLYVRKREPSTKPLSALESARAWASTAAKGTPRVPVESKASSLLVILHYLLKNNIRIYEDDMCRVQHLPEVASAHETIVSRPRRLHPREVGG